MAEYIKQEETVDFSKILFEIIGLIVRSQNNAEYLKHVQDLDDTMSGDWDGNYIKELNEIDSQYRNDTRGLKANMPQDRDQRESAQFKRARLVFRALMKLITRCGYKGFKEVEGVIEEFSPEILEGIKDMREEERLEREKVASEKTAVQVPE